MPAAVDYATRGYFCTTEAGAAVARATWGRFCEDVDVVIPTPPRGGGGTGSAPGTKYNQAPDTREPTLLALARQEDEELIILIKAFAEVIQWH